jgi:phage pi2 protein 07
VVKDIIYHKTGLVEVKIPKATLLFTKAEWVRAIKRGKCVLRNRQAQKREEKRVQDAVDDMMNFPKFGK